MPGVVNEAGKPSPTARFQTVGDNPGIVVNILICMQMKKGRDL
jgi:hypothetical protein